MSQEAEDQVLINAFNFVQNHLADISLELCDNRHIQPCLKELGRILSPLDNVNSPVEVKEIANTIVLLIMASMIKAPKPVAQSVK